MVVRKLVNVDGMAENVKRVASIGFQKVRMPRARTESHRSSSKPLMYSFKTTIPPESRQCRARQNRLFDFAQFTKQIEILHVAGAHLEDVHESSMMAICEISMTSLTTNNPA